jgi:hypothetical protein
VDIKFFNVMHVNYMVNYEFETVRLSFGFVQMSCLICKFV